MTGEKREGSREEEEEVGGRREEKEEGMKEKDEIWGEKAFLKKKDVSLYEKNENSKCTCLFLNMPTL